MKRYRSLFESLKFKIGDSVKWPDKTYGEWGGEIVDILPGKKYIRIRCVDGVQRDYEINDKMKLGYAKFKKR